MQQHKNIARRRSAETAPCGCFCVLAEGTRQSIGSKSLGRMLAERTDEVGRQRFSFVNVAADLAAPALFAALRRFGPGFDMSVIIGVGHCRLGRERPAVGHLCEEELVRAEVGYALHLAGQVCGGMRGQVKQPVFAPRIFDDGQLAAVPPAAEAESLEYRKGRRLVEDGKVEDPAFFDHLRGEVGIVDGDCQPVRRTCYLTGGIDDAAVVESVRLRGKHEDP